MPLEVWLEKSLLEFLEKADKTSDEIALLEVCAKAADRFGVPAGERRRAVQAQWNKLQNETVGQYLPWLRKG